MSRRLTFAGLCLLAATAWFVLAEQIGWVSTELADRMVLLGLKLGGGALALAVVLAVLAPLTRALRGTRCVRCGSPIEKGQTYCPDHLRATVNEYRDQLQG